MVRLFFAQLLGIILLSLYFTSEAQDTILLVNGKMLEKNILEINDEYISVKRKKTSIRRIQTASVFSVKYNDGKEKILYKMDLNSGFTLSTNDMQSFVFGEKWGRQNYKAPWATVFGFIAGAAGGYYQFWGAPVPVVASIAIGATGPKRKYFDEMPSKCQNNNYFKNGFKDYARKKKTANAIKGGLVGFLTTTIISSVLSNKDW